MLYGERPRPPGPSGPPSSATCSSCGAIFAYDRTFYERKGLRLPGRCRRCRQERAARLVSLVGEVTKVGSDYLVVETLAEKFIAFPDVGKFQVADKVSFAADPLQQRMPGKLRVAQRLERVLL